jgi:hypothetical protein
MKTKPQRVQKSAGAQYAVMASESARKVGQRIGRVSDNQDERLRRYRNDSGNNLSINARVDIKKLQSSASDGTFYGNCSAMRAFRSPNLAAGSGSPPPP